MNDQPSQKRICEKTTKRKAFSLKRTKTINFKKLRDFVLLQNASLANLVNNASCSLCFMVLSSIIYKLERMLGLSSDDVIEIGVNTPT